MRSTHHLDSSGLLIIVASHVVRRLVRNGTEEIGSFDQWSVSCRALALYLAFISARRPRLPSSAHVCYQLKNADMRQNTNHRLRELWTT